MESSSSKVIGRFSSLIRIFVAYYFHDSVMLIVETMVDKLQLAESLLTVFMSRPIIFDLTFVVIDIP